LLKHWSRKKHFSFFPGEEATVENAPHKFHFVCELRGYEGIKISGMVGETCTTSFGRGEEVAKFVGAVARSDGGGYTLLLCI
jgi:hypothetical protein